MPSLASRPGAQRTAARGSGFSAEVRYLTRTEHERVHPGAQLEVAATMDHQPSWPRISPQPRHWPWSVSLAMIAVTGHFDQATARLTRTGLPIRDVTSGYGIILPVGIGSSHCAGDGLPATRGVEVDALLGNGSGSGTGFVNSICGLLIAAFSCSDRSPATTRRGSPRRSPWSGCRRRRSVLAAAPGWSSCS